MPVAILANKADLDAAVPAATLLSRLGHAAAERPVLCAHPGSARDGRGLAAVIRALALAAGEQALDPLEPLGHTAGVPALRAGLVDDREGPAEIYRTQFLASFATWFDADAAGGVDERPCRTVTRETTPESEDPTGATAGTLIDTTREAQVRNPTRDRALARLLEDVGHISGAATDMEGVVRGVLVQLIMNLDAVTGWGGLTDPVDGEILYDSMGVATDAQVVGDVARSLLVGTRESHTVPVGEHATAGFPGGAAGGTGLFLQFPIPAGEPGWLLLVGAPGRGLAKDAEPVMRTAATFLGLAAARLHGVLRARLLHRALEDRVEERTYELRLEKEALERRIADRNRELEAAKRAAIETERCLFDQERAEGVRQLAAGVAHELNNPISAIRANLEFALEAIAEEETRDEDMDEIASALADSMEAAVRVASRVTALFGGDVSAERRAAFNTPLEAAVRDGIAHYRQVRAGSVEPRVVSARELMVGVPRAELTRWIFRILTAVLEQAQTEVHVAIEPVAAGALVRFEFEGRVPESGGSTLLALRRSVQEARGQLEAAVTNGRARIDLMLPAPEGQRGTATLVGRSA